MAKLVSVNVGLPRDIEWRGETVHTGIWKQPVRGRCTVRKLNIDGDGQGDLAGHGGEHRAVMVYQMDSYRYWEAQFGRGKFELGQFGENFTAEGLSDAEVCVGDRYRIGSALLEVTQPRVTCYRVGIRMGEPAMAALLVSHHRPGFYFRVLEEGEVGAGDEIIKVAEGPERVSIAAIDALLYLPGHSRELLQRSLRIPALSAGWQSSLHALLDRDATESGNPGLTNLAGPPPAWSGFRPLRVTQVERESSEVISLSFEPPDGSALPAALPGQFLVLRLHIKPDAAPLLRNYSLSGEPGAKAYRISVKREANGAGSSYLHDRVHAGDLLEVSAPRGAFTLQPGEGPVVLVSAGIGATPVLAMLYSLVAAGSRREVWWLYGARNGNQHPFAKESRELLKRLARGRSHIAYSQPDPGDQLGQAYDSTGHLNVPLLGTLGLAPGSDFYLCGPPKFLSSFSAELKTWGADPARIRQEIFGPEGTMTPGIKPVTRPAVHVPSGIPGNGPLISFARSGLSVPWSPRFLSLLELAEACDVPARWSCRTGVCHSCECGLIGGGVVYGPAPLEAPADGNVLVCCAQPSTDVTLDL